MKDTPWVIKQVILFLPEPDRVKSYSNTFGYVSYWAWQRPLRSNSPAPSITLPPEAMPTAIFLQVLSLVVERFDWLCHAYSLMAIITTFSSRPSRETCPGNEAAQRPLHADVQRRHRRVGHLFQGGYKVLLVEKDRHLLSFAGTWCSNLSGRD